MGAKRVAIIPNDDPDGLAHADGMVAWIDDTVLAMNVYDEPLRTHIRNELQKSFPDVTIIEVEAQFDEEVWDERMSSACGINLNSVMTKQALYVPHFGTLHDDEVIATIKEHTSKTVIPVPAKQVCSMGGSVRCLTRQSMGTLAEKIVAEAKK
jgi:agmatine/peptidylarginine deiminase